MRHQSIFLLRELGHVVAEPKEEGFGIAAFFNSSASKYIEVSWRYYWLFREAYKDLNDEDTIDAALAQFGEWVLSFDPMTGQDRATSMWLGVIDRWWG
jgi:hypothetical protein